MINKRRLIYLLILGILVVGIVALIINNNKVFTEEEKSVFSENTFTQYNVETGIIEYGSPSMKITLENIKREEPNLNMWEVNIKLKEASQIKSAFAGDKFTLDKKEKTSQISKRHNAVLAINGSAYGFNEKGFVIRDKILYRDTSLDVGPLIIKDNGDFAIFGHGEKTGQEMLDMGAMHVYDFGPDLIREGEIVDYGNTWYKDGKDPRTVIGQKGPLEYVILVIDGRSKESEGMSLYDAAIELKARGCYVGYNLDGGGSTTLYFQGKVLNKPSDLMGERKISDILYFVD